MCYVQILKFKMERQKNKNSEDIEEHLNSLVSQISTQKQGP